MIIDTMFKLTFACDRSAKLFVEEAKEAMDALSALQYEASKALSSRETLEERILELETKIGVRDRTVAELQAELESLKRKLASSEREEGDAKAMLLQVREKNCTCEENRTELNETISRLNGNIRDMQARVAEADGLKLAFEASFEQEQTLKKRLAEMQSKFEQESKRASDKESAGYRLLDTLSGKTARQIKGVGMVLRIETSRADGAYQVKQLIPGGSASKSSIQLGDTIQEVDSIPIATLQIERVQELILGPEGTTVTVTGVANGERYSETLMRGEAERVRSFEEESEEAMSALNSERNEAQGAKEALKECEEKLVASASRVDELTACVEELKSALDQDKKRGGNLAHQVAEMSKQLQSLQGNSRSLEEQNAQLLEKFSSINTTLNNAEGNLELERASSAHLLKELDAVKQALHSSNTQVQDLSRQLESKTGDLSKAANKLNELDKENRLYSGKSAEALEALYSTSEAVHGQDMDQCGVGMIVRVEDRSEHCTVTSLTPGGSALANGELECGDMIVSINGNRVEGMSLSTVQEQIVGPEGSVVTLSGIHINGAPFSVELIRGMLSNRRSQTVKELCKSNMIIAKGLHKEISRLGKAYNEAQAEIRNMKAEMEYGANRETALRLAMRSMEHDQMSASGSLQSRMAELELIRNDLQERDLRLSAALDTARKQKAEIEGHQAAHTQLNRQIRDLTTELEVLRNSAKGLERQLGACMAERETFSISAQKAQQDVQCLEAVVTDLKGQVEHSQRKLVLAASARESLEKIRILQYAEMKRLTEASASVVDGVADAERELSALRHAAVRRQEEHSGELARYKASMETERTRTAAMEKQLEMSQIEIVAARRLLDLMQGFSGERKGVGMLVRTHPNRKGDYSVKELYDGGSAALSARITVGDTLVSIDGVDIQGLTIDQVQSLIVGPEGSAVTILAEKKNSDLPAEGESEDRSAGFLPLVSPRDLRNMLTFRSKSSPPKGETYSVTLLRGDWAQSDTLLHQTEVA